MDNVRLRRLQADYESLRQLVKINPRVKVDSVSGSPPTLYRFTLQVRSLQERGGRLEYTEEHRVEIRLPLGYPRNAPVCRMLTPVFHPNIAPHTICIGDHWSAGEALDALVLRICEMLAFQSYNVKSPLNGEAAKWVEEHLETLPLDATFFFVGEDALSEATVDSLDGKRCANCGAAVAADAAQCAQGHWLCDDCIIHCETCGRVLCLVCGELECPACKPEQCANCGAAVAADAAQCAQGHWLCDDCVLHCETCGRVLCLVCGELECPDCSKTA